MKKSRIVVVGSSNTDMVVRSDRLPRPGETVLGDDLITAAGGKGANQAVAAARLGAPVTFVARVGRDMFGEQSIENFRRDKMDIRFVFQDDKAPSGVALIMVAPDGQNMISVALGANRRLSPADVSAAKEAFAEAAVVILQLETPIETVLAAAKLGKECGATVILNPAPAPKSPLPEELYRLIDFITPNETEAECLTGCADPKEAANVLFSRGVNTVIVTLGKAGALVAKSAADMTLVKGFVVKAVDAVAAGDAFNGGLAVAISQGKSLDEAVRFAHGVAAVSVTRQGAQPSLPTMTEVLTLLQSAESKVSL
jgi:ribokinase